MTRNMTNSILITQEMIMKNEETNSGVETDLY